MNSPIVIRIHAAGDAVDWNISDPRLLSFKDTMAAIHQILPDNTIEAFEYNDEDSERITVRSDEEFSAMVSFYCSLVSVCDRQTTPLEVFPKVGKTAGKRNIHGLKVHTRDQNSHSDHDSAASTDGTGSRKRSGDIREILSGGRINDSDLKFLQVLGSGNCGTVYRAEHKSSGTPMAVKVINLDVTPECQKQIMSELEVLYRCNSPVIIGFYGAYFLESRISICTEVMDGGSLEQYGRVEEEVLGHVSVSVVKGLQYLWSLRIIHRDVKPSNILVNTQGAVKLCDFGVSVQLIDSIARSYIGTNAYMAPERLEGKEYSIHCDVWSLGISLFELAAGEFPYQSVKKSEVLPMELVKSILYNDPPKLPQGFFSDEFVAFVTSCMTKDPSGRPIPQALLRHPFILNFRDAKKELVAHWVNKKLQEMTKHT